MLPSHTTVGLQFTPARLDSKHSMRMWQTIRAATLDRHIHNKSYGALVLAGGYEEAGDRGRFRVSAGDVLYHDRFEGHLDRFAASGAVVLNMPMHLPAAFIAGVAKVADPDLIANAAQNCPAAAVELLSSMLEAQHIEPLDWPDELAADLIKNPSLGLSRWALQKGLPPWTVSRGFAQVFGISPESFRARTRARRAWKIIQASAEPLVQIALRLGFADQAHMTRSVRAVTGMVPQAWRTGANGFKTVRRASI